MTLLRATAPLTATLLLGLALASTPASAESAEDPRSASSDPPRTLAALIGDAACDNDAQCRTLPMGAKSCGGPESYLAWSIKRTDEAALHRAAASEITFSRGDGRRGGYSNCIVVTDPGAYCAPSSGRAGDAASTPSGTCRLRAGGRGRPGRVD